MIACFFLWNAYNKQNKWWYYSSFLVFLLAGLIKISSFLSFFAILIIHIYLVLFYKRDRWWFHRWYNLLPYLVVLCIIVLWYKYAVYYNDINLKGIFLTGIYPIWDMNIISIKNNWSSLCNKLLPAYFNKVAFYIDLILLALVLFFYKKANQFLLSITTLVFLGIVAYSILFFEAYSVHDYYLTNLLIFLPLPIITILEILKRNYSKLYQLKILKAFAICALLVLIYETTIISVHP